MEYFAHSYPIHQHCADNLTSHGADPLSAHSMPVLTTPTMTMSQPSRIIETKPRLGKEEVEILEREFRKNPKPLTQTKKAFALEMNVDLPRINNWFQNRRAKRKQEKKLKNMEEGQLQDGPTYSSASASASNVFNAQSFCDERHGLAPTISLTGPHSSVMLYGSHYTDDLMHSSGIYPPASTAALTTTNEIKACTGLDNPLIQRPTNCNPRQVAVSHEPIPQFSEDMPFEFSTEFDNCKMYIGPEQGALQNTPNDSSNQTPAAPIILPIYNELGIPYQSSTLELPSQLPLRSDCSIDALISENELSPTPQDCNIPAYGERSFTSEPSFSQSPIDFHIQTLGPPPAPSNIPFRTRPPMNIASRRKKVQRRPAALTAHTLIGRIPAGPRTVSPLEGYLPSERPSASPMRRIVSAGGNRAVATGRVQKPALEMAQRSPIKLGGFESFGTFMEQNLNNFCNAPSLTGLSSLSSSLAPSTPLSPGDVASTKWDRCRSTASPVEAGSNYVFNPNLPGCFISIDEENQGLASPDTSQSQMSLSTPGHSWMNDFDPNENQWHSDASNEPLFSSTQDNFPLDVHIHRPLMPSSFSQPVSPAFGSSYIASYPFGKWSPQQDNLSQQRFPIQAGSDYSLVDTNHQSGIPFVTNYKQQKTFLFSHTTPADFSEK